MLDESMLISAPFIKILHFSSSSLSISSFRSHSECSNHTKRIELIRFALQFLGKNICKNPDLFLMIWRRNKYQGWWFEISRRANNQNTETASCTIVKFLEIENSKKSSNSWILLSALNFLAGEDIFLIQVHWISSWFSWWFLFPNIFLQHFLFAGHDYCLGFINNFLINLIFYSYNYLFFIKFPKITKHYMI